MANIVAISVVTSTGEVMQIPLKEFFDMSPSMGALDSGVVPKSNGKKYIASGITVSDNGDVIISKYRNANSVTGQPQGLIAFDGTGKLITIPLIQQTSTSQPTTDTSTKIESTQGIIPVYSDSNGTTEDSTIFKDGENYAVGNNGSFFKWSVFNGSINLDQNSLVSSSNGYRINGKLVLTYDAVEGKLVIGNSVYTTTRLEDIEVDSAKFISASGSVTDIAEDAAGDFTIIKPAKDGTYALLDDIVELAWLQEGNTATVATKKLGTLDNFDFNIIRNNINIGQIKSTGLDLLDNRLDVGAVQFNVATAQTVGVGKTIWNDTFGTLEFGLKGGNVNYRLGQSSIVYVKNADNSGLTKGTVVYTAGSDGTNKTVRLAQANTESTCSKTFGIVAETVSGGTKAFCITFGNIEGIDTSAFAEGATVYLSPTIAGGMTTTKPSAPSHMVVVGFCLRSHATQGVIFVKVQNGFELEEIHDVAISSLANNNILAYEAGTDLWKNKTFAEIGVATGTGTVNYLPKWSNTTGGLVNSQIFDNGTNVGIGTASPSSLLFIQSSSQPTITLKTTATSGGARRTFFDKKDGNDSGWRMGYYGDAVSGPLIFSPINTGTVGTGVVTVLNTGSVGIGTTNPTARLDIVDSTGMILRHSETANTSGAVRLIGGSYTGNGMTGIVFGANLNNNALNYGGSTALAEPATQHQFYVGTYGTKAVGTEVMRIENNGNVGIGTTTPTQKLHVFSTTAFQIQVQRSGVASGLIGISALTANSTGDLLFDTTQASQGFAFRTRDSGNTIINALGIDRNGNVGINVLNPATKLDVRGQVSADLGSLTNPAYSFVGDLNTGLYSPGSDTLALITNGFNRVHVDSVGRVGIGVSSPVYNLDILGTIHSTGNAIFDSNVGIGTISPSSQLHIYGVAPIQTITATNGQSGLRLNVLGQATNTLLYRLQSDGVTVNAISSDGNMAIGSSYAVNANLLVSRNLDGSIAPSAISVTSIVQTIATSDARAFQSSPNVVSGHTLPNLYHFIANPTATYTGVVTTQYGFHVGSTFTGATNNYGFRGAIATAANRWNLYMDGTASNYMAGSLGIGTTSLTGINLRNNKTITGGGSGFSYSHLSDGVVQSDVIGAAWYFRTIANTQATTFTVPEIRHFNASQNPFGAGSTVTAQTAFYADNTLTGGVSNYGFRGAIASGTNRWNVFMDGTAQNHFRGNVGIGVGKGVPAVELDVAGTIATTNFRMTSGAAVGRVLQSDASGNASWVTLNTSGYLGTWNANTNTPTIANGTGTAGQFYIVTTAGTWNSVTFAVGDQVYYNGTIWQRIPSSFTLPVATASVLGGVKISTGLTINAGGDLSVSYGTTSTTAAIGDHAHTFGGDVSGSGGTGTISMTLATVNSNVGQFTKVTVNEKGLVTAAENPTTVSGYGITDVYTKTESDARYVALSGSYSNPTWITALSYSKLTNVPSTFAPAAHTLDSHSNVTITSNVAGEVLKWNGTAWINNTLAEAGIQSTLGGTGLVLSTSGVITYITDNSTNWNTAFTDRNKWDGGATGLVAETGRISLGLVIGTDVQAYDADLQAIAGLAGTTGLLRKNAANTWSLDTNTYLTANQTITVSGDATGSGTTAIALALASVATAGTYRSVTINAKGLVTSGTNPTTLAGYGITDAYNKTESDGRYVNLTTVQSISGEKTFNSLLTINSRVYQTGLGGSTYFGEFAGVSDDLTSNNNVGIGNRALQNITSGSNNIAIGYEAGNYTNPFPVGGTLNTNTNSIFIGSSSRASSNGGSNEIVIGHNSIGAGSNTVTIGYTSTTATNLFGSLKYGTLLRPNNIAGTNGQFLKTSGTQDAWATIATADISNLSSYTGFDSRYQLLDADLTAIAALTGTSGLLRKTAANTWSLDLTSYFITPTTLTTNYVSKWNGTAFANSQLFDNGTSVGIAIATPSATSKLHVNNTVGNSVRFQHTYFTNTLETNTSFARGGIFNNAEYIDEGGASKVWKIRNYGANDAAGILFANSGVLNFISVPSTGTVDKSLTHSEFLSNTRMTILPTGFIGINTTTPAYTFDVAGNLRTTNLLVTSGATSGNFLKCNNVNGTSVWSPITTSDITNLSSYSGFDSRYFSLTGSSYGDILVRGTTSAQWARLEIKPQRLTDAKIGVGDSQNYLSELVNFEFPNEQYLSISKKGDYSKKINLGVNESNNDSFLSSIGGYLNINSTSGVRLLNYTGNGTRYLTINESGLIETASTPGGGTISLTESRIAFGSNLNTITESPNFNWIQNRMIRITGGSGEFQIGKGLSDSNYYISVEGSGSIGSLNIYGAGGLKFGNLTGTGTQMVVVNESGLVSRQAIPSGSGGSQSLDSVLGVGNISTKNIILQYGGYVSSDKFQFSGETWNIFKSYDAGIGLGIAVSTLAGTGTRMVVAGSNGVLSTQAIPSGSGGSLSLPSGEVAVGTGSGVTSFSNFKYDSGTLNLSDFSSSHKNVIQINGVDRWDRKIYFTEDSSNINYGGYFGYRGGKGTIDSDPTMLIMAVVDAGNEKGGIAIHRQHGNVYIGSTPNDLNYNNSIISSNKLYVQGALRTETLKIGNRTVEFKTISYGGVNYDMLYLMP